MIVSYQVKAEFGRILADKKKVKDMVENFKELQKKLITWACGSSKKSFVALVSSMNRALREDPDKENGM